MKANEIMTSAKRTFSKVGFGLQKKSPEILVGIGIVGAVASAVLACKATTKAGAIVEESKNSLVSPTPQRIAGKISPSPMFRQA